MGSTIEIEFRDIPRVSEKGIRLIIDGGMAHGVRYLAFSQNSTALKRRLRLLLYLA